MGISDYIQTRFTFTVYEVVQLMSINLRHSMTHIPFSYTRVMMIYGYIEIMSVSPLSFTNDDTPSFFNTAMYDARIESPNISGHIKSCESNTS